MKKYFIHDGKDQHGPFTIEELKLKGINSKSMIWFEGLTSWTEAQFIPELKEFIVATPPPFEKKNSINQTFDKAKKVIDKDYVNEIENKIPTKTGKKVFKYILLFFAICGFIMLVFSLNPSEEKKEENNPELFLEFSDLKIENSGYGLHPSWKLTGKVTNKARYVTYKDLKFEVEFYTSSKKPIGKIEINDFRIFTPSIDIDESKYSKYYYIDIEIDQEIPKEIDAKNSIVKLVGADIAEKEKASQ